MAPSVSPSLSIPGRFTLVGPGNCQSATNAVYDSINMIASGVGVTDIAQCIDLCVSFFANQDYKILTGLTVGFDGNLNDVCNCHYRNDLLPEASLAGGEVSGNFTCPTIASQCYGFSNNNAVVANSSGQLRQALPITGECYKNTAYVP